MKRKKVAVSLPAGILGEIDSMVAAGFYRSRSHAFETLLEAGISGTKPRACVVLAKGAGGMSDERYAQRVRKLFDCLLSQGVNRFMVLAFPNASPELLLRALKGFPSPNIQIREVPAAEPASALASLSGVLVEPFLVAYDDSPSSPGLRGFFSAHFSENFAATILLSAQHDSTLGFARVEGRAVRELVFPENQNRAPRPLRGRARPLRPFLEPLPARAGNQEMPCPGLSNEGIYLFEPEVLEVASGKKDLERDVLALLAESRQLQGYVVS